MPSKDEQIKILNEHNDELENYFRNTIIPQLFIDAGLILRKFTPPAMRQFKLSNKDLGRPIDEVKDNFRFPSIIENIEHVINSNEILEKEIQTTDLRWYQMNIIPYIKQRDNTNNGVIITFVEITFRISDLKEQEKLISDHEILLDTLSHDIKNPLTNLKLAIGQLKEMGLKDQEQFELLLNVVERSLTKMQNIIHELTESREEDHKYKAHVELLNLENILEDVRLALSDDIRKSEAVIRTEINSSELFFSRRKLRSIIYNLVSNSIKYHSPDRKPEIFIKAEQQADHIIISVSDNGIGIEESKLDDIFLKYYRVDSLVEGSGIGLYLVKEIVTNAGGKVEISSKPGEGTVIRLLLKAGETV